MHAPQNWDVEWFASKTKIMSQIEQSRVANWPGACDKVNMTIYKIQTIYLNRAKKMCTTFNSFLSVIILSG